MVNANIPHLNFHQTSPPTVNSSVFENMQKYLNLINTEHVIQVLMHCDRNNQVVDKWLLAIVFEYLQRAQLLPYQYSREKFFIALYLAIEFEEDEDRKVKDVLLEYMLHHDTIWASKRQLIKKKDKFWKKLGFRCMVTKQRLDQIISLDPYHAVWQRERKPGFSGASRSFSCKLDPPSFYKYQWPVHHHHPQVSRDHHVTSRDLVPRKAPEVIDLTKDSPPVPLKPAQRKRTSAAYRHLHSIVSLIKRDRERRHPSQDIVKMKHAQQFRLNDMQMLESLARSNSFTALNNELAHLNVNHRLPIYPFLYNTELNDYNLPGLILLPDRRMASLPMFNQSTPSPLVVPVVPRNDHWV